MRREYDNAIRGDEALHQLTKLDQPLGRWLRGQLPLVQESGQCLSVDLTRSEREWFVDPAGFSVVQGSQPMDAYGYNEYM